MNWKKLYNVLREMVVPSYIVNLEEFLYEFNAMVMEVDGEKSKAFQAEQGVRQGYVLSRQLFNISGEDIIQDALEHWTCGISVGGRRISNL